MFFYKYVKKNVHISFYIFHSICKRLQQSSFRLYLHCTFPQNCEHFVCQIIKSSACYYQSGHIRAPYLT